MVFGEWGMRSLLGSGVGDRGGGGRGLGDLKACFIHTFHFYLKKLK